MECENNGNRCYFFAHLVKSEVDREIITPTVADLLNVTYNAGNVPGLISYFAQNVSLGKFCLMGVLDADMDCAVTGGTSQPYPQYYALQLLASPDYLNLNAGGHMPVSVSVPAPLVGTAFYTPSGDSIVLVNPSNTAVSGIPLLVENPGSVFSNGKLFLLNDQTRTPTQHEVSFETSTKTFITTPRFTAASDAECCRFPECCSLPPQQLREID
jgi:hypothetical protein